MISPSFAEHDSKVAALEGLLHSPGFGRAEHLWYAGETNLQQLCDAAMPKRTKNSEECFHLQRINAVLETKGGPVQYYQGVSNKMAGELM